MRTYPGSSRALFSIYSLVGSIYREQEREKSIPGGEEKEAKFSPVITFARAHDERESAAQVYFGEFETRRARAKDGHNERGQRERKYTGGGCSPSLTRFKE